MYFTGEFIDANEAHRLGAVERVVPRDQLVETARSIATKIAKKSPYHDFPGQRGAQRH
jgi:enoyl-CoA hydratase